MGVKFKFCDYDHGRLNPTNANIEADFDRAKDSIAHFKVTSSERGLEVYRKVQRLLALPSRRLKMSTKIVTFDVIH